MTIRRPKTIFLAVLVIENKAWVQKSQDVFSNSANLGDKVKENKTENQQEWVRVIRRISLWRKPPTVKNGASEATKVCYHLQDVPTSLGYGTATFVYK